MKKTQTNLMLLYMIFGTALIVSNVIASKLFNTGLTLFGGPVFITAGAVTYPLTFLITDIIGELWGKPEANRVVKFGFVVQIIASVLIVIAQVLPALDANVQAAYITMLGQNWVFVVASLAAYYVSQSLDVYTFHSIREHFVRKLGSNKHRWIWNNLSTGTSQLIDSAIFVTIAFGLGFGWLWTGMVGPMLIMIVGQYVFKLILALLDTPFFYLATRQRD